MPGLFDGIPSTEVLSTTVSGVEGQHTTGSFTNVRTAGSYVDTQGRFRTIGMGSVSVFGGFLQTGSAVTSAGSLGYVLLGTPYSNTNFYVQLTPRQFVAGGGSVTPWISGARTTSGVNFVGAASQDYDWFAVGA